MWFCANVGFSTKYFEYFSITVRSLQITSLGRNDFLKVKNLAPSLFDHLFTHHVLDDADPDEQLVLDERQPAPPHQGRELRPPAGLQGHYG